MRLRFNRTHSGFYIVELEGDHYGSQKDFRIARISPPKADSRPGVKYDDRKWAILWEFGHHESLIKDELRYCSSLVQCKKRITGILMETVFENLGTVLNRSKEVS